MIRILIFIFQRARRDLNPRPSGPEPDALSTELRALNLCKYSTPGSEFAPRVSLTLFLGIRHSLVSQKSGEIDSSLALQISHWVYWFAVFTDFKVEMGAGRESCGTNGSDRISYLHRLSLMHIKFTGMAIQG